MAYLDIQKVSILEISHFRSFNYTTLFFFFSLDSSESTQVLLRYIQNYWILPVLMFKYCMALPVPQKPVYPDSHKNFVKVSSLFSMYVMVLDRVYWHLDREASEWTGVSDNSV